MSKKRKRHQDDEDTAIFDEKSSSSPEQESSGAELAVSFAVLDEKGLTFVQKKIFHGTKEISRAFKKARDFEVRKIIKRLKSAKFNISLPSLIAGMRRTPKKSPGLRRNYASQKFCPFLPQTNLRPSMFTLLQRLIFVSSYNHFGPSLIIHHYWKVMGCR